MLRRDGFARHELLEGGQPMHAIPPISISVGSFINVVSIRVETRFYSPFPPIHSRRICNEVLRGEVPQVANTNHAESISLRSIFPSWSLISTTIYHGKSLTERTVLLQSIQLQRLEYSSQGAQFPCFCTWQIRLRHPVETSQ